MKNIERFVEILHGAGVRWVFGVPSGPVLPLIEALRQSPVEFVLTASETSAGFMASTVGALTGVPGVCVSTLGPGATNLATGVGCAWLDRCPLIAITCNVPTSWLRRRIQMRVDHHALFKPLTKGTFPLRNSDLEKRLLQALELAKDEPPGPVHLDLPEDVCTARAASFDGAGPRRKKLRRIDAGTFRSIARALIRSRRPVVVTGLTFTRCKSREKLLGFVEKQKLPFLTTLHAKGYLPESHPNWVGVVGRARRGNVEAFARKADLILAIGYDPVEINYEEWVRGTPLVHVSTERAEAGPGLNFLVNEAVDLDGFVHRLDELPPVPNSWSPSDRSRHRERLERDLRPEGAGLALHQVLDVLREVMPPDGILAYDVGAHTHQIAAQWRTDFPGTCLSTNGWSSMGYGMPGAYAAKLVHPKKAVAAVVGDGGFLMTAGELSLARRLRLAVPVVVLNDGWLGLMKIKQERKGFPISGVRLGDPPPSPGHYFGVPCCPARNQTELEEALRWGLGLDGPSVIEAFIDAGSYSQTVLD
ncbi:MAG TPA: thiamine pyrophosphate-binding protein [Candidatus Binatia bacterium]